MNNNEQTEQPQTVKPALLQAVVSGSASNKSNPYELIWYKKGWSEKRINKNNAKYWLWEIEHNAFVR